MERIAFIAIGILLGVLITLLIIRYKAPSLMMMESKSKYSFDETVNRITAAVESKGWKMPHVHDLQATMHKHNYEVDKVKVLEICKPSIAQKILSRDTERLVSNLMPCRISVYEKSDGQVYVSRLNSVKMGGVFGGIIKDAMSVAGNESEEMIQVVAQ